MPMFVVSFGEENLSDGTETVSRGAMLGVSSRVRGYVVIYTTRTGSNYYLLQSKLH